MIESKRLLYDYCMSSSTASGDAAAVAPPSGADPDESPLDAYSRTVIGIAQALGPSVANLQVRRRTRRGPGDGAGSAVVISGDGFLVTSAHVVEGLGAAPRASTTVTRRQSR